METTKKSLLFRAVLTMTAVALYVKFEAFR